MFVYFNKTIVKSRKIIINLSLFIFIVVLLLMIGVEDNYSRRLPREPNVQDGHIFRMIVNHGFVVYGTEKEFRLLRFSRTLFSFEFIWFSIAGILIVKYQNLPKSFSSKR